MFLLGYTITLIMHFLAGVFECRTIKEFVGKLYEMLNFWITAWFNHIRTRRGRVLVTQMGKVHDSKLEK